MGRDSCCMVTVHEWLLVCSGFLYVIVLSNYTTQKCAHDEAGESVQGAYVYVCVCVALVYDCYVSTCV